MKLATARCDKCRFWLAIPTEPTDPAQPWLVHPSLGRDVVLNEPIAGYCRRYPHWEAKCPSDWCGEYLYGARA